ncbi:amidohydrolase family protein [Emcibacter sp. SYSU 3D8]|uniref:N-acyl-D-amino-acid deacylase family protein n=1 Tax=Emcibacter sp. SYSU 3D8 TaxID=3133969 RepID=UPI0031FF43B2
MAQADIVIRNGLIVDGSGGKPFAGDVAIADGRILAVGSFAGEAKQTIDAAGKVIAPGFIDIHTHYDPQLCWDRLATPSLEHGCTTVVIGNCSLSVAPIRDKAAAQKLVSMFRVIEDIGDATFEAGVPWSWESFPDYLDHICQGLGINVGALVGHSVLRLYVMGDAAQERAATDAEIAEMVRLLKQAMEAGAIGLSTSYVDVDENMKPVPSRYADMREKLALARAMVETGRGVMQTVPFFLDPVKQIECIDELAQISRETGIMCTLAPIVYSPMGTLWQDSLDRLTAVREGGANVYGQSMPRPFDLNMRLSENSFLLLSMPSWAKALKMGLSARLEYFSDPATQEILVKEMSAGQIMAAFGNLRVGRVSHPDNKRFENRPLAEVASELGVSLPRAMIDIALRDDLDAEFQLVGAIHGDENFVAKILDHPACLVGASDAGAHIAQFCGAGDTCYMLSRHVRDRGDMSLERAVHRMTKEVADAWGIGDRGLLKPGMAADVVVFDPATIDRGEEIFVHDVPGNANRYIRHPTGIDAVIVNGALTVRDGGYTAARAGLIV